MANMFSFVVFMVDAFLQCADICWQKRTLVGPCLEMKWRGKAFEVLTRRSWYDHFGRLPF